MSWNLLEAMWKWWKSRRTRKKKTKTLVTDISHQLKTPVAALHSCLEILKNQDLTVEERKEFESRLERQMKSLEQLIRGAGQYFTAGDRHD